MKNTRRMVPYPFYWDDVPVDLSFLYEGEKPAGKHGFLQVQGDRFAFEDGTPGRFWGTNFNSGLNFPDFEFSEKIARRLAKIGINIVRFHQLDAEWSTPNIFQFTKGKRVTTTKDLDPESMKRLDYLVYCLKKEGIYVYLDMLTYRKFKSGDGVENAHLLGDAGKPYNNYDRTLIELQKKFIYDIWSHINPYTGLAYKDDPVFVMTEIANETDFFWPKWQVKDEPYRSDLLARYAAWRKERKLDPPAEDTDFGARDATMLAFLVEVLEEYNTEMLSYMRKIGVKIPITGNNHTIICANRRPQVKTDFADSHAYWYSWTWEEVKKHCANASMTAAKDSMLPRLTFARLPDKPFFVSEWDNPWPNEWRAESTLLLAAAGLLQNWAGYTIHTYSYAAIPDIDVTGKEVSSGAIGGTPYREGVFNAWNDPAKFGLFYHAALMTRRGDVKEANESIAVNMDDLTLAPSQAPAFSLISERSKVGLQFSDQPHVADRVVEPDETLVDPLAGEVYSDTGEMYRSWEKRYGWIDTPRTKAAYGFLGENGTIDLGSMSIHCKTDFATIAISTLEDVPMDQSTSMLLTTIGRSENTNMEFDEGHEEMLSLGEAPILIEVIEAELRITTQIDTLSVWAINAEGFYIGRIPAEYKDGQLIFSLGEQFPSMYYLIQAE